MYLTVVAVSYSMYYIDFDFESDDCFDQNVREAFRQGTPGDARESIGASVKILLVAHTAKRREYS